MKMDLSQYKKTDENGSSATFTHPDGHSISVDKTKLSPKMKAQLRKLALHKVDGGYVSDPDEEQNQSFAKPQDDEFSAMIRNLQNPPMNNQPLSPDSEPNRSPASFMGHIGSSLRQAIGDTSDAFSGLAKPIVAGAKDFSQGLLGVPDAQASVPANAAAQPQPAAPTNIDLGPAPQSQPQAPMPDPYAGYLKTMQGAQGLGMRGIDDMAKAQAQQGEAEAALYQNHQRTLQDLNNHYQESAKALDKERSSLLQDYKAGQIDPNHYMANRSTGQKIMQAAALFLTTAGSSLLKMDNPFLKFMNAQIDRDIEAQKANLGKKKSLLDANYQQFGNLKDATLMTRVNYNDMLAAQVSEMAAKSKSPMARAQAEQLKSHLMMQNAQLMQPIMQSQALARAMSSTGGDVDKQLSYLRIVAPDRAKEIESRYVPGVGIATVPVPEDSRKKIVAANEFLNLVKDVRKFARDNSGSMNPATIARGKALGSQLQDAYRSSNGLGVFREGEMDFINSFSPNDPTAFFSSIRTDPKYSAMEDVAHDRLNELKKSYGLPVAPRTRPNTTGYKGRR